MLSDMAKGNSNNDFLYPLQLHRIDYFYLTLLEIDSFSLLYWICNVYLQLESRKPLLALLADRVPRKTPQRTQPQVKRTKSNDAC